MNFLICGVIILVFNFCGGDVPIISGREPCEGMDPPPETHKRAVCKGKVCYIKCAKDYITNNYFYPRLSCETKKRIYVDRNGKLIEKEEKPKFGRFECKQRISCGGTQLDTIDNAEILYQKDSNTYEIKCKPSYYSQGELQSVELKCENGKKWNYKDKLVCKTTPNCTKPIEIKGGKYIVCRRDFYEDPEVGKATTCFFRCNEGFLLQGTRKLVCDMYGGWAGWFGDATTSLPTCRETPKGVPCKDAKKACPTWSATCGSTNQLVACKRDGKNNICYCTDDKKFDYLKDLYLSPPKCVHCEKTGLKCQEGEVWGCKDGDPLNFEDCKCTPIKVHGRCERLRKIVMDKKFEEEFATPEERFSGKAQCTTEDIKKTMSCTFSCDEGVALKGNPTVTCDMNGVITGKIPSCGNIEAKNKCPGKCKEPVGAIISCPKEIPDAKYSCNFTCDSAKGFMKQKGANFGECNCKREWSKDIIVCKKPSEDFRKPCVYKENNEDYGKDKIKFCIPNWEGWQRICELSCRKDYQLPKRDDVYPLACNFETGNWISHYNCTYPDPYDCEELSDTKDKFFTCEEKNKNAPWKCGISCTKGYFETEAVAKNQSRVVECKHGKWWDWNNTLTCKEISVYMYRCEKEKLVGTTYECNVTSPKVTDPPEDPRRYIRYPNVGSSLTITCKTNCMAGYFLRENLEPTRCPIGNKWNKPFAKCYDHLDCKMPKETDKRMSYICSPDKKTPKQCDLFCNMPNYRPKGNLRQHAKCLSNGTWDNWPNGDPVCEPIQIPRLRYRGHKG